MYCTKLLKRHKPFLLNGMIKCRTIELSDYRSIGPSTCSHLNNIFLKFLLLSLEALFVIQNKLLHTLKFYKLWFFKRSIQVWTFLTVHISKVNEHLKFIFPIVFPSENNIYLSKIFRIDVTQLLARLVWQ